MIRITGFALVAAALLTSPFAFAGDKAGDKACCTQGVANHEGGKMCADLASLNLNGDQKSKIEAWQSECMKDGCTKESRHKFMQQAKGILTAEQFAKLKQECKRNKEAKSET
jgi:Spy/CpxP family protein refolding chaperone